MPRSTDARIDVILGVDQTGATRGNGRDEPKPLPCVIAFRSERHDWKLRVTCESASTGLALRAFTRDAINELLEEQKISASEGIALHVDCVLGLAHRAITPFLERPFTGAPAQDALLAARALRDRFAEAARFEHEGRRFGRQVAEAYFDRLASRAGLEGPPPRRVCEQLASANSVFVARPYQKNIQTGTFRIWREIGERDAEAFRLWPYESPSFAASTRRPRGPRDQRPWLLEGYPSLLWKRLLGVPVRSPASLGHLLQRAGWNLTATDAKLLARSPDLADAAVLASAGARLVAQGPAVRTWNKRDLQVSPAQEGWITAIDFPNTK